MKVRRARILRVLAIGVAVVAGAACWGEWRIRSAPLPESLSEPPAATPLLMDVRGRPVNAPATDAAREARPVRLADLGVWLPWATVAIEDRRFYGHPGVDFLAMAGAAIRNIESSRIVSGASTITQQTVKLGTGRTRRTLDAKWREAFSALRLDREWSKEKILEAYFHRLDYGNRRIGPVAAARAYFGKAPAELTFAEAVYLAGLPQSPSRLNPWRNPQQALRRYERNVRRLERQGVLPEGVTAEALLAAPPKPGRFEPPAEAPHFAREAMTRPVPDSRRSTLDLDLQSTVERIASEARRRLEPLGATACAVVVLDNRTGGIRAMVSSSLPRHKDLNLAMTPRSAGSTLKPFLYLEAIDRRILTAATLLPDTAEAIRSAYADYDPQNYNGRFLGPVRLREALGNSLNVPAVVALERVGAREGYAALGTWGLKFPRTFEDYGAGFILGNAEVTLVDLAGAYAAMARQGEAWQPTVFVGEPVEPARAASAAASAIVTDILCDNDARRLSFGNASPLDVGLRIAVKTGTSSGFRDGWCVGFTGDHTVAVWAGNPDGAPMNGTLAVKSAAPVWNTIVQHLMASGDKPVPAPDGMPGLVAVSVAKETGLLPRPGEASVREWFLEGTAPTESSGSMYGREGERETLLLASEYAAWCAGPHNRLGAKARTDGLRILFPKDGAVFSFNPNLPAGQQILLPKSTDPACEWYANGELLTDARLPLRPGRWTLTAKSAGREESATIRVE